MSNQQTIEASKQPDPLESAPPAAQKVVEAKPGETPKVTPSEERGVLEWLLGPQRAPEYSTTVKFETPVGTKDMIWNLRALPGKQLTDIEKRYTKEGTTGPLGMPEMDDIMVSASTVVEATVSIEDPVTGRTIHPRDEAFRSSGQPGVAPVADPALALAQRFHYQSGVIDRLASEVRRISGWGPERVGQVQRKVADLSGG